jgi:chloramphenicol-sensitive protein RarD
MQNGIFLAIGSYLMWGAIPIFFKMLGAVSTNEILMHRMIWSLVFLLVILGFRRQWSWLGPALRNPNVMWRFVASAVVLTINWYGYVWSVNHDRVVEASLGYFINPLVNVMMGFLLLRERLRAGQWAAIGIATLGVAWLTWMAGDVPWTGLIIAFSFATYALLRKTAPLGALEGLTLETMILFPFAAGLLWWMTARGQSAIASPDIPALTKVLLLMSGPLTAVPLLMFSAAARKISMAMLGILQYLAPTIQMLIAILMYGEPFGSVKLVGYIAIWTALVIYTAESVLHSRRETRLDEQRKAQQASSTATAPPA